MSWFKKIGAICVAAWGVSGALSMASAQELNATASTWEKVQKTKKIVIACITDPPYAAYDPSTKSWSGLQISMAKDLAKSLGVGWECIHSSWSNLALDIQSGKADLAFNVQATPARAAIINFVGPLYGQGFALIVRKDDASSKDWKTYNTPDTKISVVLGSVNDNVVDMLFPKATKVVLPGGGEPQMAVTSRRADAYLASVITGPFAELKNPNLQSLTIPDSVLTLPAYVAVRYEVDQRFAQYLRWWAEWNRVQGLMEKMGRAAMVESGIPAAAISENWTLR